MHSKELQYEVQVRGAVTSAKLVRSAGAGSDQRKTGVCERCETARCLVLSFTPGELVCH
jgi:hypothetical protein